MEANKQTPPPQSLVVGSETAKAIALGASVLARIEDPSAREVAIRNALTEATRSSAPHLVGEPVAWQWRHPRSTGGEWFHCPDGPRPFADRLTDAEYRPLFAAPSSHVVPPIERLADLIDDAAPGVLRPDTRLRIASHVRAALSAQEAEG